MTALTDDTLPMNPRAVRDEMIVFVIMAAMLAIVPFTRAENLHLMNTQTAEPYLATCTCPGCGDLCTHLVRQPDDGEPDWSKVTRQCRICGREWAQD